MFGFLAIVFPALESSVKDTVSRALGLSLPLGNTIVLSRRLFISSVSDLEPQREASLCQLSLDRLL